MRRPRPRVVWFHLAAGSSSVHPRAPDAATASAGTQRRPSRPPAASCVAGSGRCDDERRGPPDGGGFIYSLPAGRPGLATAGRQPVPPAAEVQRSGLGGSGRDGGSQPRLDSAPRRRPDRGPPFPRRRRTWGRRQANNATQDWDGRTGTRPMALTPSPRLCWLGRTPDGREAQERALTRGSLIGQRPEDRPSKRRPAGHVGVISCVRCR